MFKLSVNKKIKKQLLRFPISIQDRIEYELVKIIKDSKDLKKIPVIAVSARAMKEDIDTIMSAGFDDYVSKPIDQKILLNVMKKWLGR